jgi:flagellar biosynthesis protein FlhA
VQKVLQNLLREGVSIRDLTTILETLADHAPRSKDADQLTEHVRQALGRSITKRLVGQDGNLALITLSATAERALIEAIHRSEEGASLALEPRLAQRLLARLGHWVERFAAERLTPVLLCSMPLRPHLRRLLERYLAGLALISPAEVAPNVRIRSLGVVTLDEE